MFLNALDMLSDEDWIKMRKGRRNWLDVVRSATKIPKRIRYIHPSQDTERRTDVVLMKMQH